MVKPFSPTELAARIRAALRRRASPERPEPTEPYVVGELSVDFARRRAVLGGSTLPLTTLEHRLLVELALYAGGAGGLRAPAGADLGSRLTPATRGRYAPW